MLTLYPLGRTGPITAPDWIAVTPSGYYDASPAGEAHLRWRDGNGFWPIEKSRATYRRPDIIHEILSGGSPTAAKDGK